MFDEMLAHQFNNTSFVACFTMLIILFFLSQSLFGFYRLELAFSRKDTLTKKIILLFNATGKKTWQQLSIEG